LLTDLLPAEIGYANYTLDKGYTWQQWPGEINLGSIPAGQIRTVILSGVINVNASGPLYVQAEASYLINGNGLLVERISGYVPVSYC
jgi:hypothetical protein